MAIILTEAAANQVKKFREDNQITEGQFLRIGVASGGCSGFQYDLQFDDKYDEAKDSRYEHHGVTVVVDKKSALYLDGTTVDWYHSIEKQGFTFDNPSVTKSCGCGSSFSA